MLELLMIKVSRMKIFFSKLKWMHKGFIHENKVGYMAQTILKEK